MQIELDELLATIDRTMGEPQCHLEDSFATQDNRQAVVQFLESDSFSEYLEDSTHRTIIRHFLLNAIIQGHFPLSQLADFEAQLSDPDSRAMLALSMLVNATSDAQSLLANLDANKLNQLEKNDDFHIRLVDIDSPDDLH